jgi:hypothetical protein
MRQIKRVYRVKKKGKSRYELLEDKIDEILRRLEK